MFATVLVSILALVIFNMITLRQKADLSKAYNKLEEANTKLGETTDQLEQSYAELNASVVALREEKQRSDQRLNLAIEAIETFYTDVSEEVLLTQPGLASLRNRLLARPRDYFNQLAAELSLADLSEPKQVTSLARGLVALAELEHAVGESQAAIEDATRSIELLQDQGQAQSSNDSRLILLARSLCARSKARANTGDLNGALEDAESAVDEMHKAIEYETLDRSLSFEDVVKTRVVERKLEGHVATALADCLTNLGDIYKMNAEAQRFEGGQVFIDPVRPFLEAVYILEAAFSATNQQTHFRILNLKVRALSSLWGDELENVIPRITKLLEEIETSLPEDQIAQRVELVAMVNYSAAKELSMSQPDIAFDYASKAIENLSLLEGTYPNVPQYQSSQADTYEVLADVFRRKRENDKLLEAIENARRIRARVADANEENVELRRQWAGTLSKQAFCFQFVGDLARAKKCNADAIRLLNQPVQTDGGNWKTHLLLADIWNDQAYLRIRTDDRAGGFDAFQESLLHLLEVINAGNPWPLPVAAERIFQLAYEDENNGNVDAFYARMDQIVSLYAQHFGTIENKRAELIPSIIRITDSRSSRAYAYRLLVRKGRWHDSDRLHWADMAVSICRLLVAEDDENKRYVSDLAVSLVDQGKLFQELGNNDLAVNCFEEALETASKVDDESILAPPFILQPLATACIEIGECKRAIELLDQLKSIRQDQYAKGDQSARGKVSDSGQAHLAFQLGQALFMLSEAYSSQGDSERALAEIEAALKYLGESVDLYPTRNDYPKLLQEATFVAGTYAEDLGLYSQAIDYYQEYLGDNRQSIEALLGYIRAELLSSKGNTEAIGRIPKSLDKGGDILVRAEVYLVAASAIGEVDRASEEIVKFHELALADLLTAERMGVFCANDGIKRLIFGKYFSSLQEDPEYKALVSRIRLTFKAHRSAALPGIVPEVIPSQDLSQEFLREIQDCTGVVKESWAVAFQIPNDKFSIVIGLASDCGFEVTRVRHYEFEGIRFVAAIWRRTNVGSRTSISTSKESLISRDAAYRAEGWRLIDLSSTNDEQDSLFAIWVNEALKVDQRIFCGPEGSSSSWAEEQKADGFLCAKRFNSSVSEERDGSEVMIWERTECNPKVWWYWQGSRNFIRNKLPEYRRLFQSDAGLSLRKVGVLASGCWQENLIWNSLYIQDRSPNKQVDRMEVLDTLGYHPFALDICINEHGRVTSSMVWARQNNSKTLSDMSDWFDRN